jgi:hypothetical protein
MKKQLILFVSIILITTYGQAQIAGNAVYNYNTIYDRDGDNDVDLSLNQYNYTFSNFLEANVMINVKASAYVAIFSLTQHGNTIEEAETLMNSRIEVLKRSLTQVGATISQVFTDPVSLVPAYETEVTEKKYSKTFTEVPAGFEMKKNVHITFKNHDDINPIIAIAAKAEIYDLVKVDYVVDDLAAILDRIRKEALGLLVQKKATIEKTGMHARFTQFGEKYGSVFPMERYNQYTAYKTGAPITYTASYKKGQPQQTVQYNYAEKNKTIYYEKVSEKQFDHVINPVVGEPMVQVYITVKGQYELFDPATEAADKAYNEQLRQLELEERRLRIEEKKKDIELKGKEKDTPKTKK